MKPRLKTSPAARELIKRFEPFRPQAVKGDDGRWVVGYGHRAAAKPGVRVNEDEAALLLIYDVMRAEEVVDDSITGPLSRGQRDALTSFVHDVGVDSFRGSEVARYLFEGRARAAGEALAAFGDGISSRREAESRLFLDALLPAQPGKARKSEPVELVIKIEHPVGCDQPHRDVLMLSHDVLDNWKDMATGKKLRCCNGQHSLGAAKLSRDFTLGRLDVVQNTKCVFVVATSVFSHRNLTCRPHQKPHTKMFL